MLVWQAHHRNEWSTALQTALGIEKASSGADPFSLGDPVITRCVLEAAGFGATRHWTDERGWFAVFWAEA